MGSRGQSMAAIQAALQAKANPPQLQQQGTSIPGPLPPFVKLSADEKRAFDANRQLASDAEKAREKAVQADIQASQEEERQQQEQQTAFTSAVSQTIAGGQQVLTNAAGTLSGVSIPGGITLPLVLLLVFFFLLLPVNGHTRLVWLWLVLTGNAEIQQSQAAGSSGSAPQTGANSVAPGLAPGLNDIIATAGTPAGQNAIATGIAGGLGLPWLDPTTAGAAIQGIVNGLGIQGLNFTGAEDIR